MSDDLDGGADDETTLSERGHAFDHFPPELLKAYPERIMTLAEEHAKHVMEIETKKLDADIAKEKRGQRFGLTIGIVAIVAGGVTASLTAPFAPSGAAWPGGLAGGIIGTGGVGGLVAVFVLGHRNESKQGKRTATR